jgi:hypothetical protein
VERELTTGTASSRPRSSLSVSRARSTPAKGWAYYEANAFFWAKIAAFETARSRDHSSIGGTIFIPIFVFLCLGWFEPQHHDGEVIPLPQHLLIERRCRFATLNFNPDIRHRRRIPL